MKIKLCLWTSSLLLYALLLGSLSHLHKLDQELGAEKVQAENYDALIASVRLLSPTPENVLQFSHSQIPATWKEIEDAPEYSHLTDKQKNFVLSHWISDSFGAYRLNALAATQNNASIRSQLYDLSQSNIRLLQANEDLEEKNKAFIHGNDAIARLADSAVQNAKEAIQIDESGMTKDAVEIADLKTKLSLCNTSPKYIYVPLPNTDSYTPTPPSMPDFYRFTIYGENGMSTGTLESF